GRVVFTVDYHVGTSGALLASTGRDDDPVTSRMVLTDSEPDRSRQWMVVNDHPSDRALWSVELTVPAGEDVVANGVRTSDTTTGGARVVRYELDKRIPTYMMAFAAGEIVHTDRTTGRVPLSIWHRRGLLVNDEAHLDILSDLMAHFEPLVGPYPWPSYGVLLAPYPFAAGGMENATITFNAEASGQANIGRQVNAHELGHQWFGDWVTMADYEHVWFKEGMATVLQSEGDRSIRDSGTGSVPRLFGFDFAFGTDQAIVDRQLSGLARYTSGPYQRAAWLITQIRARIGETAFWDRLRAILDANAQGTLTGPRFLQGFGPALSAAEIDQLTATLELKTTPTIDVGVELVGSDRNVTVSLHDPDHQLLMPLELTVVDASGAAVQHEVPAGAPSLLTVPVDSYLAPDEADRSPPWHLTYHVTPDVYFSQVTSLFAPTVAAGQAAFATRSAAHQELTLGNFGLPVFHPDEFAAFYAELDSTFARRSAEINVCFKIASGTEADGWRAQLEQFLARPGIESFSTGFSACPAPQAAVDELTALAGATTAATARRLSFLLGFDYDPEVSIAQIGKVATTAPSLQLREQALSRLSAQLTGVGSYSPVVDRAPWNALFRDQLAHARTSIRFNLAWNASRGGVPDLGALPIVADRLHVYALTDDARRRVVCEASDMAIDDVAAFQAFRATVHREALSASVLEVLDDLLKCPMELRARSAQPDRVPSKPL
ncbi:MAG TPA: M1 family aminopeptidase, partial [Kofleriaceae bacterium]|nr:M1 family aminopeptidase [Kofleriaceae bacterium]